ncbi:MAG: response regulator [Calditrichaceae bacterium]
MAKLNILCIDDQREVLAALKKDLEYFSPIVNLIDCESAGEADEVLNELDSEGQLVAVIICDHIMPGETGVDFLSRLNKDDRFVLTRKLLLTGLATHQDTIQAINQANLDRYIEKPWEKQDLIDAVKILFTLFIIESDEEYNDYLAFLDQPTLYRLLRKRV